MKFIRAIFVIFAFSLICGNSADFTFQITLDDLGTKKLKRSKLDDGTPLIYPPDEFDLVREMKPVIEEFRERRKKSAKPQSLEALKQLGTPESRRALLNLLILILDSPKVSDSFYDYIREELDDITKIAQLWSVCSHDVSKVKFWNTATRAGVRDSKTRIETYDNFTFHVTKDGRQHLTLDPPMFLDEKGMGFVDFNRSIPIDPRFPLNIPITTRPGTPTKDVVKSCTHFLSQYEKLLDQYAEKALLHELRRYFFETALRHEIKQKWFLNENIPDELPNSLARYGLSQLILTTATKDHKNDVLKIMTLISPATPHTDKLIEQISNLKFDVTIKDDATAELRRAHTYIISGAMFTAPNENPWKIFRELPKEGFKNSEQFFTTLKSVYPDIEANYQTVKKILIDSLKPPIVVPAEEKKQSPPPANYIISKYNNLTIQYPDQLKVAVDTVGPKLSTSLIETRKNFAAFIENRPWIEIQHLTPKATKLFTSFGLPKPNQKLADQWAELLAKVSEGDRLAVGSLLTHEIEIWIKEDIQKIIREGGTLDQFTIDDADNTVTYHFNLGDTLNKNTYEEIRKPDFFSKQEPLKLPVVISKSELDQKSDNEVSSLIEKNEIIAALTKEGIQIEDLTNAFGLRKMGMDEQFCYFTLIHELAEADITRHFIASSDRRWFTDGMASYVACEMVSAKFGKNSGWEKLSNMYRLPKDPDKRDELLSQLELFNWSAKENEKSDGPDALSNLRYLYSALAIKKAVEGRDKDFVKKWMDEIGKARWVRANSQTILKAYQKLTGDDLRQIVNSIGQN